MNDNYFSQNLTHSIIYKGNASYLGLVLYHLFNHLLLISSLILLISMIGSIILTVDFEYRAKKNNDIYINVKRDISTVSFWNSKSPKI